MKINKDFAVIVSGKRFEASNISEIHIESAQMTMKYYFGESAQLTIKCNLKDVEFVSDSTPQSGEINITIDGKDFAKLIKENKLHCRAEI